MILSYFWHTIFSNWTLFIVLHLKHKCSSIICWQKYLLWITFLPPSLPTIQLMLGLPLFKPPAQFSHSGMFNILPPHGLQHTRFPCPSPTPGVCSNSCPSSRWCYPAISFSVVPFSSFPNPSQHQSLFQWVNSSHEVAKVLEFQL